MEPVSTTMLLGGALGGASGYVAVATVNKIIDYFVPTKWQPHYRVQSELQERLQEFQIRQQRENQMFQVARDAQQQAFQRQRDAEQRHFQMEMEANRMAFQERIEMRRLQVQCNIEKERERLTIALNEQNIRNSQEIAQFNARAMRETQILVARENAQNLLQDHMVQDALRNFPLNISPLVLLKNRPHSLSSLLRFTVAKGEEELNECNMLDVVRDVMKYAENPEALNVFVAPVYVDSKIKNREILSKQIWDTTYQQLESFFTEHYNRRSERPVIFYSTAWNDKYSPGMHASETLHFFLRDMPCIVLEPRFDGNNFRIMVSSWGLGYTSIEHIRTEIDFDINIDAILAYSVNERSKAALRVLDALLVSDITEKEKTPFIMQKQILERNMKLYKSLNIEERINNHTMNEIDALGIYNIFKVEPIQDLSLLSKMLSSQIGMTLATLTDIHHLRSTDVGPIYPKLLKEKFPELYSNKDLCKEIYESYKRVFLRIKQEETNLLSIEERGLIENRRILQLNEIKTNLAIQDEERSNNELEYIIRKYVKDRFNFEHPDFNEVWEVLLCDMKKEDVQFCEGLLPQIQEKKMYRNLKKKLISL